MELSCQIVDEIADTSGQVTYSQKIALDHVRERPETAAAGAYSWLLNMLRHSDSGSEEAYPNWDRIVEHKLWMSRTLEHDVPVVVALLDHLLKHGGDSVDARLTERAFLKRLSRSVVLDELTRLYNRRFFDELLRREVKRAERYDLDFSLLMLDLDDFKSCNDRFGHLFGDGVLSGLGSLLKNTVRDVDLPCRYGGEEFAVIFPETSAQAALVVAERVRRVLKQAQFQTDGSPCTFSLTASGGIASYQHEGETADELIAAADSALYEAKSRGKNRICFLIQERRLENH